MLRDEVAPHVVPTHPDVLDGGFAVVKIKLKGATAQPVVIEYP